MLEVYVATRFALQGVDLTTGPLGQGISSAVGMALAQKHVASVYAKPGFEALFSHKVRSQLHSVCACKLQLSVLGVNIVFGEREITCVNSRQMQCMVCVYHSIRVHAKPSLKFQRDWFLCQ